jgi:branched-chain amino acid transport system substrate-binding protein
MTRCARRLLNILTASALLLWQDRLTGAETRAEPAAQARHDSIKIGAVLPLSGDMALPGTAFLEGLQLGIEAINAEGGVSGRKLALIAEDARNEPALIDSAGKKLSALDHVSAAVTATYPQTMIAGRRFEEAGIPSIALWDSSPEIDDLGKYIFAIGPWTPASGEVAAAFSYHRLGARRAVVIHTVEAWCEKVARRFSEEFRRRGGEVQGSYAVNPDDADFRTLLAKTRGLNPDVVYAPLTSNLVPFFTQAQRLGLAKPLITSDNISDEFITKAPSAFEGAYQTYIQDPDSPRAQGLFERYQRRYGKKVAMPWHVSVAYDAVGLIARAAKEDSSRAGIARGLYRTANYSGACGSISISPAGSWPQIPRIFQVKEGKLKLVE